MFKDLSTGLHSISSKVSILAKITTTVRKSIWSKRQPALLLNRMPGNSPFEVGRWKKVKGSTDRISKCSEVLKKHLTDVGLGLH